MRMFDVYSVHNVSIVAGQGSWVYDSEGQRYLDMYGGHAVISIGHTQADYVAAFSEQISRLGFYSNSVIIKEQQAFADALGEISGLSASESTGSATTSGSATGAWQLFMCNSGAEANENALKLSSFHTGRKRVISAGGAFHGRTSLAVAATDNPAICAPINETNNVTFTPLNDIAALEKAFDSAAGDVAAVIVEAIQGVAGIKVATTEFLQAVRRLCTKHGAVYIADEIQCGCGRTGRYFATDWADVQADIYTMAKGIGNGFPMGALAIAPHIKPRKGMLGTTFGGNQMACTAGETVARVMQREGLMENAATVGEYMMDELRKMQGIKEVRGKGLMIGLELEDVIFEAASSSRSVTSRLLFDEKVFVGTASGGRVIRLLPALNVSRKEADLALEAIRRVLDGVALDCGQRDC